MGDGRQAKSYRRFVSVVLPLEYSDTLYLGTLEPQHRSHKIDLRCQAITDPPADLYVLVLAYLQHRWHDEIYLVPQTAPAHLGEPLLETAIRACSSVDYGGIKYGSSIKHGGRPYRHAYLENRTAARIAVILEVTHYRPDPLLPPLKHTCAVVQRFVRDPDLPVMPWYLQCALS